MSERKKWNINERIDVGQIVKEGFDSARQSTSHSQDSDCDVEPVTNCCRVCGVVHGDECPACGARAFHVDGCPLTEEDQCDTGELIEWCERLRRERDNAVAAAAEGVRANAMIRSTLTDVREALRSLLEWDTNMGGFEAPCWKRARRVLAAVRS